MKIPQNTFRDALKAGKPQIGCWVGFASPDVAEALAGCGFDWLLIDGEHAPNDVRSILHQLQAIASAASALPPGAQAPHPIARVPVGDTALIKQYLDLGAQTLLVPMVDTPEQAQDAHAAVCAGAHGAAQRPGRCSGGLAGSWGATLAAPPNFSNQLLCKILTSATPTGRELATPRKHLFLWMLLQDMM